MEETSTFIHSFLSVPPLKSLPQEEINEWIVKAHAQAGEERSEVLKRFCVSSKLIASRSYECDEINEDWGSHKIYPITKDSPGGASIDVRTEVFAEGAKRALEHMYEHSPAPDHLIHVTCTGYISPSPPQVYFSQKNHVPDISHAYHMGCYASLPSIRLARALAPTLPNTSVDVVHTEMCSLHLKPDLHTPEQLVVQSLFADGFIKYNVNQKPLGRALRILTIKEKLIPDSLEDMTWIPSERGMQMTLSREVPAKIQQGVREFVTEMCEEQGLDAREIFEGAIFAVHPGGPKIIDSVEAALELKPFQVEASKEVLRARGNMSSATLPHVWEKILNSDPRDNRYVISLAFGPGLTIFGGIFELTL